MNMKKDVRTKQDFIDFLKEETHALKICHDFWHINPNGSRLALQATVEMTKLAILCNDLSISAKASMKIDDDVVVLDDVKFINPSYALATLISHLEPQYIQEHLYLTFNDEDLLELIKANEEELS